MAEPGGPRGDARPVRHPDRPPRLGQIRVLRARWPEPPLHEQGWHGARVGHAELGPHRRVLPPAGRRRGRMSDREPGLHEGRCGVPGRIGAALGDHAGRRRCPGGARGGPDAHRGGAPRRGRAGAAAHARARCPLTPADGAPGARGKPGRDSAGSAGVPAETPPGPRRAAIRATRARSRSGGSRCARGAGAGQPAHPAARRAPRGRARTRGR